MTDEWSFEANLERGCLPTGESLEALYGPGWWTEQREPVCPPEEVEYDFSGLSDLDLVQMQNEVRGVPEDKKFLDAVLVELGNRQRERQPAEIVMNDSYSWGNRCLDCGVPITNQAWRCRVHAATYWQGHKRLYGCRPKLIKRSSPRPGRGEVIRQAIVEALANGPLTTPELARAIGITVQGTRYACLRLVEQGRVTETKGYRSIWTLVDGVRLSDDDWATVITFGFGACLVSRATE